MAKLRVLYFVEDRAQEGFIVALVERIASELSMPKSLLSPEVKSGSGRGSRVISEFVNFIGDIAEIEVAGADMIVVAIDANCKGYMKKAELLTKNVEDTRFRDILVFAIPDPHIERWYLLDQEALKKGTGLKRGIQPPAYKCEKNYYKTILRNALQEEGIDSLVGGSEFGPEIARNLSDLYAVGKQDPSFAKFVEDATKTFQRFVRLPSPRNRPRSENDDGVPTDSTK